MPLTDISLLVSDLQQDEGFRANLYDDATGAPIHPGSIIKGHPTAGFGFALDVAPLTRAESLPILTSRATAAMNGLIAAAPWVANLAPARQRALGNMAYNLGVTGLLKFILFLSLMQAGKFDQAADDLETTPWFTQVGARGVRIVAMIRAGI